MNMYDCIFDQLLRNDVYEFMAEYATQSANIKKALPSAPKCFQIAPQSIVHEMPHFISFPHTAITCRPFISVMTLYSGTDGFLGSAGGDGAGAFALSSRVASVSPNSRPM
jgi:hypothetical protein